MTELDLAIELGLINIRSNSFNNTVILNQRLVNHILSLKKEKEEGIEEERFELAEEDISPMGPPTQREQETIVELKPIPNFVWEQTEHQIDHPVYKQKKILSMKQYAIRKLKEMNEELFNEKYPDYVGRDIDSEVNNKFAS